MQFETTKTVIFRTCPLLPKHDAANRNRSAMNKGMNRFPSQMGVYRRLLFYNQMAQPRHHLIEGRIIFQKRNGLKSARRGFDLKKNFHPEIRRS